MRGACQEADNPTKSVVVTLGRKWSPLAGSGPLWQEMVTLGAGSHLWKFTRLESGVAD